MNVRFGRSFSFLNGWFVGSMLIFQGVVGLRGLHLVNPILMKYFFVMASMISYEDVWYRWMRKSDIINRMLAHHDIWPSLTMKMSRESPRIQPSPQVIVWMLENQPSTIVHWQLGRGLRAIDHTTYIFSQLGMRERGWLRRRTRGSSQVINGNQM